MDLYIILGGMKKYWQKQRIHNSQYDFTANNFHYQLVQNNTFSIQLILLHLFIIFYHSEKCIRRALYIDII